MQATIKPGNPQWKSPMQVARERYTIARAIFAQRNGKNLAETLHKAGYKVTNKVVY